MQKVFSHLYNDHPFYVECLSLRPFSSLIDHEIITKRVLTNGSRQISFDSDIERVAYLQKNPSAWYLDADVVIKKWPDFKMDPDFLYLSYEHDLDRYDLWCMLGNDCQWIFDYLMEHYYKCDGDPKPFWAHALINNELRDKVRPVPDGYFEHVAYKYHD